MSVPIGNTTSDEADIGDDSLLMLPTLSASQYLLLSIDFGDSSLYEVLSKWEICVNAA